MSRIGRQPVEIPAGVTVTVSDDKLVTVKGPKGTLTQQVTGDVQVAIDGSILHVTRSREDRESRAKHGLYRVLIHNMITGVTEGFSKSLTIVGTGYRAALNGKKLALTIGYSHPVELDPPANVTFEVPAPTSIVVKGINKEVVGQTAAIVREVRPPEPYLGKGIRYENEKVRRKAGKAAK
ncbi:50S ribosomal protein L6 [Luoshenia tenuis]|jgi:large subunit ribosomal protein L6|uniref:50S ribosomal protein L6 n=1 Tax=Luoshenia tenuis TaxID=2763654 RepID=UPI003D90C8AC